MSSAEKIFWAPKVPQPKIWQLYRNDARGIVDQELIDDVGGRLYARCWSVLLVSSGQVECPRCGARFAVGWGAKPEDSATDCPTQGCGWATTGRAYHDGWRHRDLIGTNALPAFQSFVERYPAATSAREKMLLIDQLIHAFHWSIKSDAPHRSAANNLIEGNHAQVVALLDTLTYGDESASGTRERHADWRAAAEQMKRRRA
jgi:hypothetical protein